MDDGYHKCQNEWLERRWLLQMPEWVTEIRMANSNARMNDFEDDGYDKCRNEWMCELQTFDESLR